FVEGPEAGNWNYGVFRVEANRFDLCLDMTGKGRPQAFRTAPGTGHACETLRRATSERPASVTGGDRARTAQHAASAPATPGEPFPFVESATLSKLQGDWAPIAVIRDGQE